jgi:hypothetical protein
MAAREMTERDAFEYFRKVFGSPNDQDNGPVRKPNQLGYKDYAMENFKSPNNQELKIENTLWAAYNAVIWAIDWRRKNSKDRVDDLCLGNGARLKQNAFDEAELLMK